jgi:hypothetical protein
MKIRSIFTYGLLAILVFLIWMFSGSTADESEFSEKVKVSLREVGNQLLLSNQDSTSLILPIVALENSKYELSFQEPLSFAPGTLVSSLQGSFQRASLPLNYLVEVIQCSDYKVAYSYEIRNAEEKSIIPCAGRVLPEGCYTIEVKFIDMTASVLKDQTILFVIIFIALILLIAVSYKRKQAVVLEDSNSTYDTIGSFRFYQEQNKLVKAAVEIDLSKKECELLAIFVANPNQIIKRDELTKKVWEDNGVIVGRSLDTYISKLRKKLITDDTIKLKNIHGVGYKLEINK